MKTHTTSAVDEMKDIEQYNVPVELETGRDSLNTQILFAIEVRSPSAHLLDILRAKETMTLCCCNEEIVDVVVEAGEGLLLQFI